MGIWLGYGSAWRTVPSHIIPFHGALLAAEPKFSLPQWSIAGTTNAPEQVTRKFLSCAYHAAQGSIPITIQALQSHVLQAVLMPQIHRLLLIYFPDTVLSGHLLNKIYLPSYMYLFTCLSSNFDNEYYNIGSKYCIY